MEGGEKDGEGGLLLFMGGPQEKVEPLLGRLRTHLLQNFHLIDSQKDAFLWITDFPLFGLGEGEAGKGKTWHCLHHPFTAPQREEDLLSFLKAPSIETIPSGSGL